MELVQFVQRRAEEVGALFPSAWGAPRALALRLLREARPSLEAKIAEFQVCARAESCRRGSGALSTWPTARQARGGNFFYFGKNAPRPRSPALRTHLTKLPLKPSALGPGFGFELGAVGPPLRLQRPSARPPAPASRPAGGAAGRAPDTAALRPHQDARVRARCPAPPPSPERPSASRERPAALAAPGVAFRARPASSMCVCVCVWVCVGVCVCVCVYKTSTKTVLGAPTAT